MLLVTDIEFWQILELLEQNTVSPLSWEKLSNFSIAGTFEHGVEEMWDLSPLHQASMIRTVCLVFGFSRIA